MGNFLQRIDHPDDVRLQLTHPRNDLTPDGTLGVVGIHQRGVIGRDIPPEYVARRLDRRKLVVSWIDVLPERLFAVDTVAHLPLPVSPLRHPSRIDPVL